MDVIERDAGFPLLIYDETGYIVQATDKTRIVDLHAGAVRIMRGEVDQYAVSSEEAAAPNSISTSRLPSIPPRPKKRSVLPCPAAVAGNAGLPGDHLQ